MHFSLLADYEIDRITALTPEWLEAHGIRLLLLDFDNTIVPYTTSEPTEEFLHWKEQLAHAGISMMVVSNSRKSRRVPDFCEKWDIPWIRHAGKPNPKGNSQRHGAYGAGTGAYSDGGGSDLYGYPWGKSGRGHINSGLSAVFQQPLSADSLRNRASVHRYGTEKTKKIVLYGAQHLKLRHK